MRIRGYVLGPDSIPVENAYLISYTTLKAYATDENGYIDMPAIPGDSMKIHHVAYQHRVVHPNDFENEATVFLDYEDHVIGGIDVNDYKIHEANFNANNYKMQKELVGLTQLNYRNRKVENPYTNNQFTNTQGVSLSEVIALFKKKKK